MSDQEKITPDDPLRGSLFEILGVTDEALMKGSEDSNLLETLRIAHEVLGALRDANVLGTFRRLPKEEQANFLRWIAATDSREFRGDRTATFVLALREAPLSGRADLDLPTPVRIGDDRDRIAHDRDVRADAHDKASDDRDDRADDRDTRADARDERNNTVDPGAVADRVGARRDRRGGASDRDQAADDREAAASDRELSAQERTVSSIDELTGAYQRDTGILELRREIERAKRTQRPLVLAFVDVDGLKDKNDSLGHLAGDELLRQTVFNIRNHLRSYDLVVRFGGDEFLCAFLDVSLAEGLKRFESVNAALGAAEGSITAGLAEMRSEDSLEDLIARADKALYEQRQPPPPA